MITVSYKDFISNSGNIQLDKIEDKLRNLFLVDSKIKLKGFIYIKKSFSY